MIKLEGNLDDNYVSCDESVSLTGIIDGTDNKIIISKFNSKANISIKVHGNNNIVFIDTSDYLVSSLKINIGNFSHANNVKVLIGKNFQCNQAVFYMDNPKTDLVIGDYCMFSNGISIRVGELAHMIFDKNSKQYVDITEGVYIGDHVWVCEGVYITKKVTIPHDCIVAANAVVTKRFSNPFSVLAGNPAREVKTGIQWVKNRGFCLRYNSDLFKSFEDYYTQAMKYTSEKIDSVEDFIEVQRKYIKNKNSGSY